MIIMIINDYSFWWKQVKANPIDVLVLLDYIKHSIVHIKEIHSMQCVYIDINIYAHITPYGHLRTKRSQTWGNGCSR